MVLSLLDSRLSAAGTWLEADANWIANCGDLSDFRFGKRWRRMAFFGFDSKRLFGERGSQVRHAGLRIDGCAHRDRVQSLRAMVGDIVDWYGGRGTPGLLL